MNTRISTESAASKSARFWSRVAVGKPGECWPWQGRCDKDGYGTLKWEGRTRSAHRLAWELHHGAPPAQQVLHRCDNPPCCNPGHLFEGTPKTNAEDRTQKDRGARGERHGNARFTDDIIRAIRADVRPERVIAFYYKVDRAVINAIKHRKTWKHVKP